MKKIFSSIIIIALNVCTVLSENYYIDATGGNDTNTDLSPEQAWASLNKVNCMSFVPGDSVLFKAGEVWNGQLLIDDKGTESQAIVYTSYVVVNENLILKQNE